MNGLEKMQQRLVGMEKVQAHAFCRERANRIAHLRSALRRYSDVSIRSAVAATRSFTHQL